MTTTSRTACPTHIASSEAVALTIEHVLMGALGAVAFFGVLAMFNSPFKGVLANFFVLSIAIAAIAAIAVVARNVGALSPQERENARIYG